MISCQNLLFFLGVVVKISENHWGPFCFLKIAIDIADMFFFSSPEVKCGEARIWNGVGWKPTKW